MKTSRIIGFRSNKLWKKVIAVPYYLILLIFAILSLSSFAADISLTDKIIDATTFSLIFFSLSIPLVVEIYKDKLSGFFRKKSQFWIVCVVGFLFLIISSGIIFGLHTPEYIAAQELRQALRLEQENQNAIETFELTPDSNTESSQPTSELTTPSTSQDSIAELAENVISDTSQSTANTLVSITNPKESLGELSVHFIDVGQADSILIIQGSSAMLIDAGNNSDDSKVVSYLKKQGIQKLEYVIGTHPHEDHIGGLDTVIQTFELGKIILPNASSTTQTFEDVLNAIQSKNLKITKPVTGTEYSLGQATVKILGPVLTSFSDKNDASVVCKVIFGDTSFLFEGDAESGSERAMIEMGEDISANVVKIGHHGSSSSTSSVFLNAVLPSFAVISVGAENQYGHPTSETLDRLKAAGISVFRTDIAGTVVAKSNGESITFNAKAGYGDPGQTEPAMTTTKSTTVQTEPATTENPAIIAPVGSFVYITDTGSKYHQDGCRYLSESKIEISLADAIAQGYEPCSVCDP